MDVHDVVTRIPKLWFYFLSLLLGDGVEEIDRGFEGWDDMEEAYAFRYSGGGQPDLCKDVIVKIMVMADLLMVDAAPVDTESLLHLEIKLWFPQYPNFMSLIFNLHF